MKNDQSASTSLLSVVVIGRNEGPRLERCLASIAAIDHTGFDLETIYVDSASTDNSAQLAAAFGANVIVLNQVRTTAALGRNAGWRAASGNLVIFLDGDTIVNPRFFLQAAAALSRDPSVAVVWGHRREIATATSVYNRVLDLDWIYAPGPVEFCGGDALFRRTVLERTGGFDDMLIAGEEPELCRRITALGYGILHLDAPMTGHDLSITHLNQYWRRATRAGHAFAEVSERFRHTPHPFWLAEARRNRVRGLGWIVAAGLAVGLSIALRSLLPALAVVCVLGLLAWRTAYKARWKTSGSTTLLLYGVHSQLQQIPIFVGQLQFFVARRRGTQRGLVEYKRS